MSYNLTYKHSLSHSIFVTLASFMLLLSSCGIFTKTVEDENFTSFYTEFNADVDFQMSRIDFPIEGYRENLEGKKEWNSSNWIPHRAEVSTVDKNEYSIMVDRQEDHYKEIIESKFSNLYFSRTFVKKEGKWFLVACVDIND